MSGLGLVLSLPNVGETVEAARMAEQAGFESVWTTDFTDRSATVAMGAIAAATERITIGSAIAYAFGHTPLVLAAEARDLDALSGGRIILGLGTGTRRATGGAMTDAVSDRMLDTVALAGTPREQFHERARECSSARCCGRRPAAGWPPPRS